MGSPLVRGDRRVCSKCLAIFRKEFERCPLDGTELIKLEGEPLVDTVISDRYRIEKCIGEGGMGRVYLARHQRVSRRFAIKILYGELASEPKMRKRFSYEAEAASRLSHRNVISVVDFGETSTGLPYLVMDYVDGQSLSSLLKKEAPLERSRIVRMLYQLADGLRHAHEKSLVHRDFKPDNVIVALKRGDEVPKILDFGIAHIRDDGFDHELTTAGYVMGTAAYMSPEQSLGDKVDERSDLYSLGVVLYQMLSGVRPFVGSAPELVRQTMTVKPPPIRERVPGLDSDPALEAVAHRLMAKKPDDRYQSTQDLMEQLGRLPIIANRLSKRIASSSDSFPQLPDDPFLATHRDGENPFIATRRDDGRSLGEILAEEARAEELEQGTEHVALDEPESDESKRRPLIVILLVLALAGVAVLAYLRLRSGASSAGSAPVIDAAPAPVIDATMPAPDAAPPPLKVVDAGPADVVIDARSSEPIDAGTALPDARPTTNTTPSVSRQALKRRLEAATKQVHELEAKKPESPRAKRLADKLFKLSTQYANVANDRRERTMLYRKLKAVENQARRALKR